VISANRMQGIGSSAGKCNWTVEIERDFSQVVLKLGVAENARLDSSASAALSFGRVPNC
jgi:hypothetical protein